MFNTRQCFTLKDNKHDKQHDNGSYFSRICITMTFLAFKPDLRWYLFGTDYRWNLQVIFLVFLTMLWWVFLTCYKDSFEGIVTSQSQWRSLPIVHLKTQNSRMGLHPNSVQSLCRRTPNPVQYLDFGDKFISLLGMIKCCFGDIIKDNCRKFLNIARTLRYPPLGSHNAWTNCWRN